jgi:hypothetical protein
MTGLQLPVALVVACFFALSPAPSVAADPKSEVDIRSEDGRVVIAADQIRSYDWATHTLTLAPKVREKLAELIGKDPQAISGIPFAVNVGGKVVYKGRFTSIVSSRSIATPIIVVNAQSGDSKLGTDQLQIQLGYPTAEFFKGEDPRADKRIREALKAGDKLTEAELSHTEWLAKAQREMATIKPGMTRADLLKVFQEEGGLSTRTQRRYVYRGSLYIKVDVTFEAVGVPGDKLAEAPKDKITKISKPFLEWSIID